ncbi:hypothetical protein Goarm_003821, partial [Gossypium armourianum]|nr:hypothetical protein [Gossypium armourianum]
RRANSVVQGARSQLNIGDQNIQRLTTLSHNNRSFRSSSSDESDSSNPPSQFNFEYLEHDQPFSREPLVDKVFLCPLFPIYRIPMGPTLQNLDACFLTYHSLSTPSPGTHLAIVHMWFAPLYYF